MSVFVFSFISFLACAWSLNFARVIPFSSSYGASSFAFCVSIHFLSCKGVCVSQFSAWSFICFLEWCFVGSVMFSWIVFLARMFCCWLSALSSFFRGRVFVSFVCYDLYEFIYSCSQRHLLMIVISFCMFPLARAFVWKLFSCSLSFFLASIFVLVFSCLFFLAAICWSCVFRG